MAFEGDGVKAVRSPRRVTIVTSGIGPTNGGIGVVTRMIVRALEPLARVKIWRHYPDWPRLARVPALAIRASLGWFEKPDFILYEHVDLAKLHAALPFFQSIPYGFLLYGVESWRPFDASRTTALLNSRILASISNTTLCKAREVNNWLPDMPVVWLGVPPTPAPPTSPSRSPTALIVGRMAGTERFKGHDEVLSAWPLIRRAVPSAQLVIAGTGCDMPRLMQRTADEGIEGVQFRGFVSDAELREYYRTSRVFLFPSRGEGFGLAPVEAAEAGMAVVGLKATVMEELFPPGTGPILIDDLSPDCLAASTIPLLSDAELAAHAGELARRRVHEVFLEEHFVARFRKLFATVLD